MSKFTQADIEAASQKVNRLSRELDVTNADHIALWLEANDPYDGDAWLAVQIIEAHERATATLRAQNAAMKEAIEAVRDGYKSQMKFCDIEALGYFREFVRRIDNALAQVAK